MIDKGKLAIAARARRGKLTLREAADESGLQFSTHSRVENGLSCDLNSFTQMCAWIGVPMEYFRADQPTAAAA